MFVTKPNFIRKVVLFMLLVGLPVSTAWTGPDGAFAAGNIWESLQNEPDKEIRDEWRSQLPIEP